MNMLLLGILAYVLLQLGVGLWVSRQAKNEEDYLIAGRRLPLGMSIMTIFATWFGAETCIGASGEVYALGLSGGRADPFGYALCIVFMGLVFAVPLWRHRFVTLGDLFRDRFSPGVERLAVILLVPTSVMWAAAQIRAFGQVISASSSITVPVAVTAAAVVVIVYTAMGGMMADAVTDVLQGVVLIAGLVLMLGVTLFALGSLDTSAALEGARLSPIGEGDTPLLATFQGWMIPIVGSVLSQELVARTLAARSPRIARNGAILAGGLYFSIGLIPVVLGLLGPSLLPGLEDSEQFLPALARNVLHPVLYVIFAGALISAILSTVDSALLAAGALTSHNLILPLMPAPSERMKLRVARGSVVAFGFIAYVMAIYAGGVYQLVEEASAFGSAGVFVVVCFGLFTRRGGVVSAYATLALGIGVYVVGEYVLQFEYAYLASLGVALAAYTSTAWASTAPARSFSAPAGEME
jgi:Na+/proline symporter